MMAQAAIRLWLSRLVDERRKVSDGKRTTPQAGKGISVAEMTELEEGGAGDFDLSGVQTAARQVVHAAATSMPATPRPGSSGC